jgi:hypothetical protein
VHERSEMHLDRKNRPWSWWISLPLIHPTNSPHTFFPASNFLSRDAHVNDSARAHFFDT